MSQVFKPEDFESVCGPVTAKLVTELAQARFDVWLSYQVPVYRGTAYGDLWSAVRSSKDTHTAILSCIGELKPMPCAHEVKYYDTLHMSGPCKHCGVNLVLKWEVSE